MTDDDGLPAGSRGRNTVRLLVACGLLLAAGNVGRLLAGTATTARLALAVGSLVAAVALVAGLLAQETGRTPAGRSRWTLVGVGIAVVGTTTFVDGLLRVRADGVHAGSAVLVLGGAGLFVVGVRYVVGTEGTDDHAESSK